MTFPRLHLSVAALALIVFLLPSGLRAQTPAKTFVVNSVSDRTDATPGDGICNTGKVINGTTPECTLRAALDEVNALSTGSNVFYAVTLPAGLYQISITEACRFSLHDGGGYITITSYSFCLTGNLILNGANPATTIIDGGSLDRIFLNSQNAVATISNVTLQNGAATSDTCCYAFNDNGSGIDNQGTLTLSNDIVTQNAAEGVYNAGTLTVIGTTFSNNSGDQGGSGSAIQTVGPTSIDSSYFTGNTGDSVINDSIFSAGYYTSAPVIISNSTFTANTSRFQTISFIDTSSIVNSVIAFNSNGAGAVKSGGYSVTINNSTIYGNTGNADGLGIDGGNYSGVVVSNTIVTGNGGQHDCGGPVTDGGHNLFGNGCTVTDPTSQGSITDPKLSALEIDGGTVPTMTPLPGSPAIGGGSSATPGGNATGACAALDQNGLPRGVGSTCSVGAAEPIKGFQVNHVTPTAGGNGGNVTMFVTGSGFDSSTTVVLRRSGQSDIAAQAQLPSRDATALSAGFSLVGAALGSYDVVVTSSTGTVTLPAAFTVANPTSNAVQTLLSGPTEIRPGRPATFSLTYINPGNDDAYLVPLFLGLPNGYTGGIKGLQTPPTNTQQALTDYSSSSLAVVPETGVSTVNLPLLLPVVPAGSKNVLTFTVISIGGEGDPFSINQQVGIAYSSNADTGVADTKAINALVSSAVLDDTQNLGVTPSADAQTAMGTYAQAQLQAVVAAGQTALMQSNGAAPIVYSISQLLDDVGAYGAAYKSSKMVTGGVHPFYLPSPWHAPVPPNCDETPMEPGSSCNAPFAPYPHGPPANPCQSNFLLEFIASQNNDCPPGKKNTSGGKVTGSVDPNLKSGPAGVGAGHYTLANTSFPYLIEFENEATASAPAQTVSVADTLDTTKLDLSTFQFGPISFGSAPFVLNPPAGVTSFQGSVDLRPVDNIIVDVTANLNTTTGVVTWNFTSLDPATMQLTTDPTAGFLPPDTTPPAGIGHVNFTINPLGSVADASTICNTATVVFDTNSPINTAQYCNTKDITPPTSMVQPLASTQSTTAFTVTWAGSDTGSGVGSYTIYVSDNGGAFTAWQSATTATGAQYTGVNGHTYSFYSIATDLVGNVEAAKTLGEASTTVTIVAAATLSPASVPFGAVAIGSSVGTAVTVTSTGSVPLTVTGFTLSDTVNFAQTNTCSSALSTGQTCTVNVVFSPTSSASVSGPTNATLSLVSNAATAPSAVMLTGTAFSPTPYIFVVNSGGSVSSLFSNGSVQSSAVAGGGIGAAVDRNGLVFSITADGTGVSTFSDSGALVNTTSGVLKGASALAIDGGDQLWIAAPGSVSMGQILGNGTASYADSTLQKPSGVAIDLSGNVWISDSQSNTVHEIVGGGLPTQPLATAVTNKTPGTEPQ